MEIRKKGEREGRREGGREGGREEDLSLHQSGNDGPSTLKVHED